MRLYAFLLVAGAALHARAATIPVSETEKKLIDIVPDHLDKVPDNTSSEQELIDQANSIKDVDNKLRAKPEGIPVEVVEDVQLALKTDDEIIRPIPDLRNPGPPQRQEHETQNPEYYASEQQSILLFKKSVNDAQNVLSQGFQGIADGIQNMLENNEPIQTLQQSILSLRDGFTAQMNKLNGTVQSYLNTESSSVNQPAVDQTKAGFHQIEQGLFKLRNDFNRGVSTLVDGIGVVATLKPDNEVSMLGVPKQSDPSSGSTSAPDSPASSPAPVRPFIQYMMDMQTAFNDRLQNFTDTMTQFTQNGWNSVTQGSGTTVASVVPAEVQSDTQVTSAPSSAPPTVNIWQNLSNQISQYIPSMQTQNPGVPGVSGFPSFPPQSGQFGSGSGPVMTAFQNSIQSTVQNFVNFFRPGSSVQPAATQPPQTESKPVETSAKPDITSEAQAEPTKPATATVASVKDETVTVGPIRQMLQNNPISQGIASAVQRLQNINNPEKPRDEEQVGEQVKEMDEVTIDSDSKKGHHDSTGDNNDSSDSGDRVEQTEAVKEEVEKLPEVQKEIEKLPEVQKEIENLPEVQKVTEDEIKEHKTEEVVDKTE